MSQSLHKLRCSRSRIEQIRVPGPEALQGQWANGFVEVKTAVWIEFGSQTRALTQGRGLADLGEIL